MRIVLAALTLTASALSAAVFAGTEPPSASALSQQPLPLSQKAAPGPLTPRITIRQVGTARAGEPATFDVTSENNWQGDHINTIKYGDGTPGHEVGGADFGCATPPTEPTSGTTRMSHIYRYPGTWTVTVRHVVLCKGRPRSTVVGTGTITVEPAPGVPSNGPFLPFSGPESDLHCDKARPPYGQPPKPAHTIGCYAQYGDEDGFLRSLVLRWGDGSPDTVFEFPLSQCVDPKTRWPATWVDDEGPMWPVEHRYPAPGKYRAYATVTTSGCDGKDVQTATRSTRVVVE